MAVEFAAGPAAGRESWSRRAGSRRRCCPTGHGRRAAGQNPVLGRLYDGPIGKAIVQADDHPPLYPGTNLVVRPGIMKMSDLRSYVARVQAPTHVRYRGLDIYGMAPPSSSGSTVGVPLHSLLSPAFATRRCLVHNKALASPVAPGDPAPPYQKCKNQEVAPGTATFSGASSASGQMRHTNNIVTVDKWGDIADTNTLNLFGGTGMTVPKYGFLLNDEMTDFDFAPPAPGAYDPNLAAGGKGAWALAVGARSAPVDATVEHDVARRAATLLDELEGLDGRDAAETPGLTDLARRAGLPGRELMRRALAWRYGGIAGLEMLLESWDPPAEKLSSGRRFLGASAIARGNRLTDGDRQLRLGRDGRWYPFRKSERLGSRRRPAR